MQPSALAKTRRVILPALAVMFMACAGADGFDSDFAPTGARGTTDEFGRQIYLDEECGGTDDPDYTDYFQNALLRDGHVHDGKIWLVDGTHLWSAELADEVTQDTRMRLEKSFIGHGNAVAATDRFLAIALVEQGLTIYPDYNFSKPVRLKDAERILDVDAKDGILAVAAGSQGLLIYDMNDPVAPVLTATLKTGGYASGARWGEDKILYFSACSVIGAVDFTVEPLAPRISPKLEHPRRRRANRHRQQRWRRLVFRS